jgi:hypothetical protein
MLGRTLDAAVEATQPAGQKLAAFGTMESEHGMPCLTGKARGGWVVRLQPGAARHGRTEGSKGI